MGWVKAFNMCFVSFLSALAVSPAPKAPSGSGGPSCRPPWVTDSNFADRYAPDKTSTVLTQHKQPAQPTPMQNRSSILQAAQQGPTNTGTGGGDGRTPLCAACNKIIRWVSAAPCLWCSLTAPPERLPVLFPWPCFNKLFFFFNKLIQVLSD